MKLPICFRGKKSKNKSVTKFYENVDPKDKMKEGGNERCDANQV